MEEIRRDDADRWIGEKVNPSEVKMNFINPLICPKCLQNIAFAADVKDFKDIKGCKVCFLASWYRHEPPSSHCPKCGTPMEWTGHMMVTPELKVKIDKETLCENHSDFLDNPKLRKEDETK